MRWRAPEDRPPLRKGNLPRQKKPGMGTYVVRGCCLLGVVVQWLDYLAVTQEPGVRFPTSEKVASDVAPPSGHKLHLTSGTADMAMWSDCNSHTVVAHDQSCVEVLWKPLISRRLCPPSSDGYLVERES